MDGFFWGAKKPQTSRDPPAGDRERRESLGDEMPYDDLDPANYVYHERQESALCLRHALNSLVQANFFRDMELTTIGRILDEKERLALIATVTTEEDVKAFYKDGYQNARADGFFSVEVMLKALLSRGLRAIRYHSSEAAHIRQEPENQAGFIINYQNHWYSIRKIGGKWFNLNSTFKKPRQLSNTYLHIFITEITQGNFSVFAIEGNFPAITNEELIRNLPDRFYVPPKRSNSHQHKPRDPPAQLHAPPERWRRDNSK